MIRLAFYTENYILGGAERYLADLIANLDSRKYEIVLLSNPNPPFKRYIGTRNLGNIPHRVVPILKPLLQCCVWRKFPAIRKVTLTDQPESTLRDRIKAIVKGLWRYATSIPNLIMLTVAFRSQHIDILHINNGGYPAAETCRLAPLAAHLAGIPVCVMTVHSPAFPHTWPYSLDRALDRQIADYLQMIITMSESTTQSLQEVRGIPCEKIRPMDLGIKVPSSTASPSGSEIRFKLDIPQNAVVVGMVGRFDWYKGHRYLLEAARQVLDSGDGDNLWLLLVGEGDELFNMKTLAHTLGLADRAVFTGRYPDALAAMRACDILTMLSVGYEGQGYVNLEAMTQSRPVIATNIRGLREVVEDNVTGLLVAPADSKVLADALRQLIRNEQQRLSMGKAGRRRFEERFTLDRMLENTQFLYMELLARRGYT